MKKLILILLCLFAADHALSHARLIPTSLVPRSDNPGLKTGPCGGVVKSLTPTVLQAGSVIQIDWEETINHPGRFEFYFSEAGEQNFVLLKTVVDDQDGINDLPHKFSTSLTLPNVFCTDCVIQMIQVMTENPAMPRNYYSCADIQLQANPGPAPSVTPTPAGPTEPCH